MGFSEMAVAEAAQSRSSRPVMAVPRLARGFDGGGSGFERPADADDVDGTERSTAGGVGRRRVLVHPSGFRQSPYADLKPPGEDVKAPPRKLWHASPGSSGR